MRYLALGAIVYVLLLLEAVVLRLARLDMPVPDLAQTFVVYIALSRRGSAPAQAAFALGVGYLCDVLGGAPRGLHATALVALAAIGRVVASRVYLEGFVAQALAALAGGALSAALVGVLGAVFPGAASIPWPHLPAQLFATALLGPPVFALGRRLDARLGLGAPRPMRLR